MMLPGMLMLSGGILLGGAFWGFEQMQLWLAHPLREGVRFWVGCGTFGLIQSYLILSDYTQMRDEGIDTGMMKGVVSAFVKFACFIYVPLIFILNLGNWPMAFTYLAMGGLACTLTLGTAFVSSLIGEIIYLFKNDS